MENKSGKGNGQTKGKPAIRSAGNQTTGNCNKLLLVAERGRTDKVDGRLNKQNPVGSQKMNPINKSDEQAKTQAQNDANNIQLKKMQAATDFSIKLYEMLYSKYWKSK